MPEADYADTHPSLLFIAIPTVFIISAYYVRKWYNARQLRLYGIGKGAPGFQTNVRRVRVTPEIAARIRRGEDVSPAEIEAASRKADLEKEERKRNGTSTDEDTNGHGKFTLPRGVLEERDDRHLIGGESKKEEVDNEWLPENITKANKRKKSRK